LAFIDPWGTEPTKLQAFMAERVRSAQAERDQFSKNREEQARNANTSYSVNHIMDSDILYDVFENDRLQQKWSDLNEAVANAEAEYHQAMGQYEYAAGRLRGLCDEEYAEKEDCEEELEGCHDEAEDLAEAYVLMWYNMAYHRRSFGAVSPSLTGVFGVQTFMDLHAGWYCYHWREHTYQALKPVAGGFFQILRVGYASESRSGRPEVEHNWVAVTLGEEAQLFGKNTLHFDAWLGEGPNVYNDEQHDIGDITTNFAIRYAPDPVVGSAGKKKAFDIYYYGPSGTGPLRDDLEKSFTEIWSSAEPYDPEQNTGE